MLQKNEEIVRKPAVPQVYTFSSHIFYATNAISQVKKKIELHFHCLAALKSVKFHANAGITKTADELC